MTGLIDARPSADSVVGVADNVVALMRAFGKARARMLAAAAHDVEWSAHVLLKCLHNEGPMRAGELAECLQSDPSTVSRQVATLVKDGLLQRQADPADGRASILVLTDKAAAVLADHDQIRVEYFTQVLADWADPDLTRFAEYLRRFVEDYDNVNTTWITNRVAQRPTPARSTN